MNWLKKWLPRETLPGPVVIGGVGGSGTRVLAECLTGLGFYVGSFLNPALDNLWYTLLLRREELFPHKDGSTRAEIDAALALFTKAMTEGLSANVSRGERKLIARALDQSMGVSRDRPRKARSTLLDSAPPDLHAFTRWGWKEPNTHIHIESLADAFPDLRYVLLIRHGLDMAFSRNTVQLKRWGKFFDAPYPANEEELPRAALHYWVQANRRVISLGRERLGPRFLILNFEDLCSHPEAELNRFFEFLEMDPAPALRSRLVELSWTPESAGRYREHGLSCFDPFDVDAVRELGFRVEL